jgi:hypothetical protein
MKSPSHLKPDAAQLFHKSCRENQKKGGDNQTGHHLPGWGGVLLGKFDKLNPIIAFDNS